MIHPISLLIQSGLIGEATRRKPGDAHPQRRVRHSLGQGTGASRLHTVRKVQA
jgi:hypothetical protein